MTYLWKNNRRQSVVQRCILAEGADYRRREGEVVRKRILKDTRESNIGKGYKDKNNTRLRNINICCRPFQRKLTRRRRGRRSCSAVAVQIQSSYLHACQNEIFWEKTKDTKPPCKQQRSSLDIQMTKTSTPAAQDPDHFDGLHDS